ncbi:MAG TPA: XRE family transcriptional regulator [Bacteroidales bacterium]|nr:XRE family transcriptional regulator [Bacteroidales bacterium]HSA43445.1 XRE family transcriptional regulator [Bacteroidales bacterium]
METGFANRLISARKMAGLSLQAVADKLDNIISKQSLNKYEQGKMKPDSAVLISLAQVLGVSVDYFYSEPAVAVNLVNVEFREFRSKLTKSGQVGLQEKAKEVFERYFELENILNLNEQPSFFTYSRPICTIQDAEDAAKSLRIDWELGYDPIPDVVEMLEDKGYKVAEIDAPPAFNGLKAESNGQKVIVLRKSREGEDIVRKRFTALHELAHHSLTFPDDIEEKKKERLCHAFACAVLYPEEMAHKELHRDRFHFYQNELVYIKERWGISIAALFSRALTLGIINDYVYKKFIIGYKARKLHEPGKEPGRFRSNEVPVRFNRLIYLALAKEIISVNEAAYFSGVSVWRFREQMQPFL